MVAERPVRLKTRGNARRGKGPQVWRDAKRVQACGSASAITPRYKGDKKESRGITCKSEGAGPTGGGKGSVPSGRQQVWRCVGEGIVGEAVQLLEAGGTQNLRSRGNWHGRKRLRTGVPCARRMIPLESRMR